MILKLIDRQLVRGYFVSYIGCLSALLSLYIVVDLFTNLDAFTKDKNGLMAVSRHIVGYYAVQVPQIFDRMCEAIVLLAAMFTVAWMQRNNEMVPLLSAGISTRRIVVPVLFCALATLSLAVLNQELLIPRIADRLSMDRDDPEGGKTLLVRAAFEPNKVHIEGQTAVRKDLVVQGFRCTLPQSIAGVQVHIEAKQGTYVKATPTRKAGWELTGATYFGKEAGSLTSIPEVLDVIDSGHYFLYTRDVDFDVLTRNSNNWFQRVPTWQLLTELNKPDSTKLAGMAVLFHTRLTRPLLGMVLLLMGLSVILRDQNRNVIISSGMCLVLCAVFFAACYMSKLAGENELVSPAAAAWAPVLLFGPFAIVLFDAVHT